MPTEEKKSIKIRPTVDVIGLMVTMANDCQSAACTMGVQMASGCLQRLAKRACELKDPQLLDELKSLGLVVETKDG